jgi:hypothetical protein
MAFPVSVEEVIGARGVLIDALLYEAHSQDTGIEVDVLLRVAGNARDVVKSFDVSHD